MQVKRKGTQMKTRKLKCTITGNWDYCTEERYQRLIEKYGGEENLLKTYASRIGKKIQRGESTQPTQFKNRIKCTVTGQLLALPDPRKQKIMKKNNWTEDELRKNFVCRVAKRLRKEGKTDDQIREMAKNGNLPKPVNT